MQEHEYASLFPPMTDSEFAALVEDIRSNGLIYPIITYQDQILDGRHRFKACSQLGIEPRTSAYRGSQPFQVVVSSNLHRRHLSESQRAMLANRVATRTQADQRGPATSRTGAEGLPPTQAEAAAALGISERTVQNARALANHPLAQHSTLPAAVERGVIALSPALELAQRLEPLAEAGPPILDDLVERVVSGSASDLDDAQQQMRRELRTADPAEARALRAVLPREASEPTEYVAGYSPDELHTHFIVIEFCEGIAALGLTPQQWLAAQRPNRQRRARECVPQAADWLNTLSRLLNA
jgi:ParB-like nuclease family protein